MAATQFALAGPKLALDVPNMGGKNTLEVII
jgi:hypothetical protein